MRHFFIPNLPRAHADNGGLGVFSPGWKHPGRLLTSSVILLGLRGTVPLTIDGEDLAVAPGRLVLLPAGFSHVGTEPLTDQASYLWIHFTLPEAGALLSQEESDTILSSEGVTSHLLEEAAFLPLQFDLPEPEPHVESFRALLNQQENPTYTGWKFQLLFHLLLIHLTETVIEAHRPPKVASPSSSVVYGVLACVAENLTNPDLSIKSIAGTLGLNLDYAGRRFKQVMGVSAGDYILRERIKVAVQRLKSTSETLDEIAAKSGFGSTRNFLRQFKARLGLTPTEVRNQYKMMHFNML